MYIEQEPSTKLLEFNVVNWLNGSKRMKDDQDKVIIVRFGIAFLCKFILKDINETYNLKDVFTWGATSLDGEDKQKYCLDLNGTLEEFGDDCLLKERIYSDIN